MNDKDMRYEIFSSSHFPWWEWDVKTNSVEFSDLKATMIGYDPDHFHEKGYQAFTELLHPDDYEKTMDAMRKVLRGETDLYQTDYRILAKNGEYHWYMDRGIVHERDEHGGINKLRGIVIDLGKEAHIGSSEIALVRLLTKTVFVKGNETESILTLCSSCQKAKSGNTEWIKISGDLEKLIAEKKSHGICPDCIRLLYPEIAEDVWKKI